MITLAILEQRLLQFPYFDACLVCFFFDRHQIDLLFCILIRSVLLCRVPLHHYASRQMVRCGQMPVILFCNESIP